MSRVNKTRYVERSQILDSTTPPTTTGKDYEMILTSGSCGNNLARAGTKPNSVTISLQSKNFISYHKNSSHTTSK